MSAIKPGNGGLRIQSYNSTKQAATEVLALAQGTKHDVYATDVVLKLLWIQVILMELKNLIDLYF